MKLYSIIPKQRNLLGLLIFSVQHLWGWRTFSAGNQSQIWTLQVPKIAQVNSKLPPGSKADHWEGLTIQPTLRRVPGNCHKDQQRVIPGRVFTEFRENFSLLYSVTPVPKNHTRQTPRNCKRTEFARGSLNRKKTAHFEAIKGKWGHSWN